MRKIIVLIVILLSIQVQVSTQSPFVESPVCGDDTSEFLVEEMGESRNSQQYDGEYGCTYSRNRCLYRGETNKFYAQGDYRNTGEMDEETGRLKNDVEYCGRASGDDFGTWYDMDYGDVDQDGERETCTSDNIQNSLYGRVGVDWINESEVRTNPHAFTGGIDDDWNSYLDQKGRNELESKPNQDTWNFANDVTPIPTGSSDRPSRPDEDGKIATIGFCGGDDQDEYLITQRCNTGLCETDNSYIGVADDPEKCLLEEDASKENGVDVAGDGKNGAGAFREIYDEGETVEVQGSTSGTMACYNGEWNDKWPVSFARDQVKVPLGTQDRIAFQLINVESEEKTFNLELSFPDTAQGNDLDSFTTFEQTGTNEMKATVEATDSQTYNLRVRGNKEVEDFQDVELQADSQDGSLSGFDTTKAKIVNMSMAGGEASQQERDIPGITWIQMLWIAVMASTIYFFSSQRIL